MSRTILAARRAGGVPPTITVAPVLTWTVEIGTSPAITPPTYTGDAGTITYTLLRDGAPVASYEDVSEATLEAYVATASDIGPELDVVAEVTNGSGADSEISNTVVFNDATYLPGTAIGVASEGVSLVSGAVDQWASSYGGLPATLVAIGASNRPAPSAGGVGGRDLITSDGVNDAMLCSAFTRGASHTTWELSAAGHRIAYTAPARVITYESTGAALQYGIVSQSAAVLAWYNPNNNASTTSDPDGLDAIWSGDCDAGTGERNIRKNGVVEATSTGATTSKADGQDFTLMARRTGADPVSFAYQAWSIGPKLTTDQRAHHNALIKYLTGIGP